MATMRVWDRVVRACHWSIAAGIALAWWSRHGSSPLHDWHELIGYLILVLLGMRLLWLGLARNPFARLSSFVLAPADARRHLASLWQGGPRRYLGHTPLGGWMALILWSLLLLICLSGWLYTTDRFWGLSWLEQAHAWSTYLLLALLPFHLLGVLVSSMAHRENLLAAMISGNKRSEG